MSNPDILTITPPGKGEVIKIAPDGRLFWHGREVATDEDFRAAMLDLAAHFKNYMPSLAPRFTPPEGGNTHLKLLLWEALQQLPGRGNLRRRIIQTIGEPAGDHPLGDSLQPQLEK